MGLTSGLASEDEDADPAGSTGNPDVVPSAVSATEAVLLKMVRPVQRSRVFSLAK